MKHRVVTVLTVLIVLHGATSPGALGQVAEGHSRNPAPTFSLKDASGGPVRLSDYKGRVVLLNFWATWCHGCKTEIPWYMDFQTKYGAQRFTVIGASMDDGGWKAVKPFIQSHKLNYPVVIAPANLAKRYGVGEMPLSILIDRDGRIADSHAGVVDRAAWESEIQRLLNEGK
jgi:peroxiredoxin